MMLETVVYKKSFAPFVGSKEQDRAGKRATQRRKPAAIKASSDTLLSHYCVVGRGQRAVFRWYVRIALLSSLDGIKRVHQHVSECTAYSSGKHCLRHKVSRLL